MYLVLNTQANGGNGEDPQTSCAVVGFDTETFDYWLGMMDQAAQISAKLGKAISLVFDDWTPEFYEGLPTCEAFTQDDEDAVTEGQPGYCWLETPPFPEDTASHSDADYLSSPAEEEPVRLSYCQMVVDANGLYWNSAPKYGDVEEYTHALTRTDLYQLRQTCLSAQN